METYIKKPKVSVITTSFNLASMVEETIQSVLKQKYDNFEYIIIDGASTDGSLDIIKKYPNIILLSEKDTGYPDAFWKGLLMAKGEYILQCSVSDGYISPDWIKTCADILDADPTTSLVWGFSRGVDNAGKPTPMSHPEFQHTEAPQKEKMFEYWLKTYLHLPEVNLCVRKSVLLKCYPSVEDCKADILDWLEFSYRFHSSGYLSLHVPVLANFVHINHSNQLGKKIDKSGLWQRMRVNYENQVKLYKWKLMLGLKKHNFIDSSGNVLPLKFGRKKLIKEYVGNRIKYVINKIKK